MERRQILDACDAEEEDYGFVYTKKAGWIDLGHAIPRGARKLWEQIRNEPAGRVWPNNDHNFIVKYDESMAFIALGIGIEKTYRVRRELSLKEKKSVAMAIYFEVSMDFEKLQGQIPLSKTRDSSFSGEDLVSNLIGFYRAVEPGKKYVQMCDPVSKEEALKIFDRFGPIGKYKNRQIRPLLFHLNAKGPVLGQLPPFLRTIQPAKNHDKLYSEYLKSVK
ncbi:MAG TPA: hypothetical protein VEC37_18710 [Bacillota bacterium]|nr:hypothetical protein [Bacillota bacterium]